ncbi:MAG: hypothetical protein ACLGIG_01970 [Actinomycetes bacterium]
MGLNRGDVALGALAVGVSALVTLALRSASPDPVGTDALATLPTPSPTATGLSHREPLRPQIVAVTPSPTPTTAREATPVSTDRSPTPRRTPARQADDDPAPARTTSPTTAPTATTSPTTATTTPADSTEDRTDEPTETPTTTPTVEVPGADAP